MAHCVLHKPANRCHSFIIVTRAIALPEMRLRSEKEWGNCPNFHQLYIHVYVCWLLWLSRSCPFTFKSHLNCPNEIHLIASSEVGRSGATPCFPFVLYTWLLENISSKNSWSDQGVRVRVILTHWSDNVWDMYNLSWELYISSHGWADTQTPMS